MTNPKPRTKKYPDIHFTLTHGDTEYLNGILENFPEKYRGSETHTRILEIIQTPLRERHLEWRKEQKNY